jgi:hypothetical protein
MAVGDHAREPHAAFTAADTILDEAGVLLIVEDEQPSQSIDDPPMPRAWNIRHLDDSSCQLVKPTFFEIRLDELVQRHATAVVGRADAEDGQRRARCGHGITFLRFGNHSPL